MIEKRNSKSSNFWYTCVSPSPEHSILAPPFCVNYHFVKLTCIAKSIQFDVANWRRGNCVIGLFLESSEILKKNLTSRRHDYHRN
jgi:hypothetical protein